MKYYVWSGRHKTVRQNRSPIHAAMDFFCTFQNVPLRETIWVSEVGFPGGDHPDHVKDVKFTTNYIRELAV